MENAGETITYRIDKARWVRVCENYPDNMGIIMRANWFSKPRVVADTHKDKAQEIVAKGFVRIKPKNEYEIKVI